MFQCISMCLNVSIDIVIGISPSHSHSNIFAIHTHLHVYFSFYTMTPFPTGYTSTLLFFHSHWSIPAFIQSKKKYISILTFYAYTSLHIPHSIFHIPCHHWLHGAWRSPNSLVVHICKICEFFYCPLRSFVCHHKIVIKDLKVLNIKILEIQKMVIAVLGKLQKSKTLIF
jgi:hypothetical protein